MSSLEDSFKSTAYDGRLQFLETLGGILRGKTMAVVENNYYQQERLQRQILYMLRAFIKPSEYEDLLERLNKARDLIKKGDKRFIWFIDNHLDYVDSQIYYKTIHVLLPVSTDEAREDIDWEEFKRQSDL